MFGHELDSVHLTVALETVCVWSVALLALTLLGPRVQRQQLENVLPIVDGRSSRKVASFEFSL